MITDQASAEIFENHADAESSVKALQHAGLDMRKMSIVGKDYHTEEHVVGYYNAGDRMSYWGKYGAFWGGMWGILFGAGFFFVPGVGPLVVAGPLVGAIVGGLEGAVVVGGLSALGAGLYGLGIPKNEIVNYETAIKSDKYVLVVHGTPSELARARQVLSETNGVAVGHAV